MMDIFRYGVDPKYRESQKDFATSDEIIKARQILSEDKNYMDFVGGK
jgi:hypothetical protein